MFCKELKIPWRFAAGVFVTLSIFLSFTGCAPPVGHLSGSAASELWAVPHRMVYHPGDSFLRDTDLSVFTSSNGNLNPVNVLMVEIRIKEDPTRPENTRPVNGEYKLNVPGRKIITLTYQGLTAEYSIQVGDPNGNGNGSGGGNVVVGGGTGTVIGDDGIIWVY